MAKVSHQPLESASNQRISVNTLQKLVKHCQTNRANQHQHQHLLFLFVSSMVTSVKNIDFWNPNYPPTTPTTGLLKTPRFAFPWTILSPLKKNRHGRHGPSWEATAARVCIKSSRRLSGLWTVKKWFVFMDSYESKVFGYVTWKVIIRQYIRNFLAVEL